LNQPISKSSLSDSEARLVELLQVVNFGRLEHLQVRGGVPILDPGPDVIRTRKMGSPLDAREELSLPDYWLKQPVVDLIETIRKIGDGEILSITIQHGWPHLAEICHDVNL
jgi:hypothetical protein